MVGRGPEHSLQWCHSQVSDNLRQGDPKKKHHHHLGHLSTCEKCKALQDSSRKHSVIFSSESIATAAMLCLTLLHASGLSSRQGLDRKKATQKRNYSLHFHRPCIMRNRRQFEKLDISWYLKQFETRSNLNREIHTQYTQSHSHTCTIRRLVMSKLTKKVLVCTSNAEALRSGSTFTCPQSWTVNLNCAISCYFQGSGRTFYEELHIVALNLHMFQKLKLWESDLNYDFTERGPQICISSYGRATARAYRMLCWMLRSLHICPYLSVFSW